jgi:hypothetical protein
VKFIANKTQMGNIRPSDFNLAAWRALIEWFMDTYGNKNEYQPGRPVSRIAFQMTQKINDDLRMFVKPSKMIADNSGRLLYPDGVTVKDSDGNVLPAYVHASSMMVKYVKKSDCGDTTLVDKYVPVSMVKDEKLSSYLSSDIVTPSMRFPICVFYDQYIQLYPAKSTPVSFTYLREPAKPNWAYTTVNGRPVYDAPNSTNIEAPEQAMNDILIRICAYVGINLREGELEQYAQLEKQQGI